MTRTEESMYRKALLVLAVVSTLIFGICMTSIEVSAQGIRITADKSWGCSDREYFDKLVKYVMQEDREAFEKGLAAGLLSGKIVRFEKGEEVFRADDSISSSGPLKTQKVRRRGEVKEYWIPLSDIK